MALPTTLAPLRTASRARLRSAGLEETCGRFSENHRVLDRFRRNGSCTSALTRGPPDPRLKGCYHGQRRIRLLRHRPVQEKNRAAAGRLRSRSRMTSVAATRLWQSRGLNRIRTPQPAAATPQYRASQPRSGGLLETASRFTTATAPRTPVVVSGARPPPAARAGPGVGRQRAACGGTLSPPPFLPLGRLS